MNRPEDYRKTEDSYESFYEEYLSHFFPNFKSYEILFACNRYPNEIPDPDLWGNFIPTLCIVQSLREFFGRSTVLTSVYRNPPYNAGVGGKKFSTHIAFMAGDTAVAGVPPQEVRDVLLAWRESKWFGLPPICKNFPRKQAPVALAGFAPQTFRPLEIIEDSTGLKFRWRGGLGTYIRKGMNHIDTRGRNYTWEGK